MLDENAFDVAELDCLFVDYYVRQEGRKLPVKHRERLPACFLRSAWHPSVLPEFKNYGYCRRYDMTMHASEWCETCDIVHTGSGNCNDTILTTSIRLKSLLSFIKRYFRFS
jgi:hypothetical protein